MNKVLIVIDSLGIGGAEKAVLTLAEGFHKKGISVDLISIDNKVQFEVPEFINLHILDFQKSFLDYIRYSMKLHTMIRKLEKENDFDLILVNLQKATRLMKRFSHKNIYHIIHSNFTQSALKNKSGLKLFFRKRKLQKIYNNLNLITVSKGIQKDLIEVIGVKPRSIQTIYNPINFELIKQLSSEMNPIQEKDYIVHVGRFAKVKRHDILLKAFKEANLDTKLVLVGDGEEKENIKHLIKELKIEDKVILTGFLQNPYPVIKNAKLLVLSSEYEGLPTVLLEALALKTLVVSTDCLSGPREILRGELSCLLTSIDYDSLSTAMQMIYYNQKNIYIPRQILASFYLDYVIQKYQKLLVK